MLDVITDINIVHLIGMAAAIFVAAILRAFTGFGFALAALPVLSLFLPPTTSASIVVLLTLGVSLQTFRSYIREIPLKPMASMIILSAIGTVIGTFLLLIIDAQLFKLLIGITVMIACLLLTKYHPKSTSTMGGIKDWLAGFGSGLMNGAIAAPGPPVIIYAMAVFPEAVKSRAFLMTFFLFSAIFAILSYTVSGILGMKEIILFIAAYPAMLAGDKLGFWLFENYGSAAYRKIAILALFIVGASITAAVLL